jgi:hypothetical protein
MGEQRSYNAHPLGHPAKNDCSTEVLLDFCTIVTFLRSVPGKQWLTVEGGKQPSTRTVRSSAAICELTRGGECTNFEGEEKESQRILLYLKGTNRYSRQCISLLYIYCSKTESPGLVLAQSCARGNQYSFSFLLLHVFTFTTLFLLNRFLGFWWNGDHLRSTSSSQCHKFRQG